MTSFLTGTASANYSCHIANRDGYLSRAEVQKYLRSFITMLAAMNDECSNLQPEYVHQVVDTAAADCTAGWPTFGSQADTERRPVTTI